MGVEIGMKFGHLTVISQKETGKKRESWLCECDCGNKIVLGSSRLLGSKNRRPEKSCGCQARARNGATVLHKRLYEIWRLMIRRCHDPKADNYERYGAQGVYVCDEWRNNFDSFLEWSHQNGYTESLTIDRKEPSKPYEPSNCRWVSYTVQNRFKRTSRNNKVGHKGVCYHKDGYRAYISWGGKRKHLGVFKTIEDAVQARKKAEEEYNK